MLSSSPSVTVSSLLLCLLPSFVGAISLDCTDIRDGGAGFNLKPLSGPHSVFTIDDHANTYENTTFTIDVCKPLKKANKEDCPNGSRVCAIKRLHNYVEGDQDTILDTYAIAGEFSHSQGGAFDPKPTRLRTSPSTADREREGLRLEMHGGSHEKQKQKAVVEFICQRDGKVEEVRRNAEDDENEGDDKPSDGENPGHDHSGEEQSDGHGGILKFVSWKDEEDNVKVLRLEWDTQYACEDADGNTGGGASSSGHWGFFTWLIIILFMGIAAYLIFGSWLNYNRYSARGWDVLPHSDTIQDLPYLFRDWMRRVINTVQGGGSRGGYSAV